MSKLATYIRKDLQRVLFPLDFVADLLTNHLDRLEEALEDIINEGTEFALAQRVFGAKRGRHLRRTTLVDPIAQYALYKLIHDNWQAFEANEDETRKAFGFRFKNGAEVSPTDSHKSFKSHGHRAKQAFEFGASFDISSYFNTIYHHEIVSWFERTTGSSKDAQLLGKLLREVNAGKSIDCLPQGLSPTKILGANYLEFVDRHSGLMSDLLLRYMDDFYIFSNSLDNVYKDFDLVQRIIGERGLDLNPSKTILGKVDFIDPKREIDKTRRKLLETFYVRVGYDEVESSSEERPLKEGEIAYLHKLLEQEDMSEDDAQLVLTFLADYSDDPSRDFEKLIRAFPSLARQSYYFVESLSDSSAITNVLLDYIEEEPGLTESQLFWFGKIAVDTLERHKRWGRLMYGLLKHGASTPISRSVILECSSNNYGLMEAKETQINSGQHGWETWASMYGLREKDKASRNQLLKYAGKGNRISKLVAASVFSM